MRRPFDKCFPALALIYAASSYCQQPDQLVAARALLSEGKVADSEAVLRQYVQSSPTSAEAHFLLGYVLFREQKARDSLAEYTAGARYQHPHAADLKTVASDYVLLGDYADADKWFSEVVSETPADADAWYLLGRTKYNENDIPAAVSSFEQALTLRPQSVETENNLGLCWKEMNQPAKAETAFQTAIDWQGSTPTDAQPFLNLGTLLADRSDWDKALSYLTAAAQLSPENPKIYEELGDVYSAQQKLTEAQRELEHAISLAPNVAALHFKLGQVYRKQGIRDLAQKEFEICARLNGTHSSATTPNPLALEKPAPPQ